MNLNDRLTQIENRRAPLRLYWMDIAYPDQPLDEAVKQYEAGHGPIGDGVVVHWDVFGEATPRMSLHSRLNELERQAMPGGGIVVIHQQYPDQPNSEATAAYEAEHGPINDPRGDVLRVFIKTFG